LHRTTKSKNGNEKQEQNDKHPTILAEKHRTLKRTESNVKYELNNFEDPPRTPLLLLLAKALPEYSHDRV
jgi:hypothetical protein